MTVGSPTLAVAASTVPVASAKVSNTKGTPMTILLLTAGTAENVNVSQVKISFAATDTLAAASTADTQLGNVTLMDGSTVIAGPVSITDGTPDYVLFSGLTNLIVSAGATKALTVVVDVVGTSGTFYAGQGANADISGSGAVSGTAVESTGGVKSGASLAITGYGTLTVSVDSSTPLSSNIPVGVTQGAQGVYFSSFKLESALEDMNVSSIKFTRSGGADSDFGAVYLYSGTSLLGTSYMNATTVTFNFSSGNEIVVPANTTKVIAVKADLMGIDAGSTHADAPKFYIASVASDMTTKGASSQASIAEATTTPSADNTSNVYAQYLYKTTASVSLNSGLASGTLYPSAATEVMRVDIKNNGYYDLTLTSFDLTPYISGTVSTSSDNTTKIALYWSTDLTTAIASATTSSTTVPVLQNGVQVVLSPTSTTNTVGAGQTKTLVVKAFTTGLTSTGNSIQMALAAVADFGWTPAGGSEVTARTPGLPLNGPSFVKP
jgi:hypothetical protein